MSKVLPFLLSLAGALSLGHATAQPGIESPRLAYGSLPDLPPQHGRINPGVAGAYAGVSNGVLLVAGGANFPDGYPWQNGTKVWQSTAYALTKNGRRYAWKIGGALTKPRAYGASVVWNNQLIGLGGNDKQSRYAEVFTLTWNKFTNRLETGMLPELPLALANESAAVLGDVLYVFGGESDRGTEKSLYRLNLRNTALGWQKRAELPGSARAFSVLVAQGNALYVLGGRETVNGTTTVFGDAYQYEPTQDSWAALPALPSPLAAHGAAAVGSLSLLIFGGDDGVRLGLIEQLNNQLAALPDGPEKTELTQQRNVLQSDHPGFRREVWQFRTDLRTWTVVNKLPFATPVTTPVLHWNNRLIIPSGEVSPGIRTPGIRQITVSLFP